MLVPKLLLKIVGVVFINIENNKLFWITSCYLTAQLTSDRASAARNQNDLAGIERLGLSIRNAQSIAEKEILNLNLAYNALCRGAVAVCGSEIVYFDFTVRLCIKFMKRCSLVRAKLRQSNKYLLHRHRFYFINNLLAFRNNLKAQNSAAYLVFILIDEANRAIVRRRIIHQLLRKQSAHLTRTDYYNSDFVARCRGDCNIFILIYDLIAESRYERHYVSHSDEGYACPTADSKARKGRQRHNQYCQSSSKDIGKHQRYKRLGVSIAPYV